ncbi:NAD(P)-dependent dehydrogenase, short-chain alcohol dehydrogenase family [Bradyrhizobium lablabi]|uniref:NAD(P)-dependent dehydrogenase, short-chain alcohol dehydrogenase family n=1 Tax=Bradyrhizobium lablabi TaxID=722472 RepID=A0A1M6Z706_9BRAD|nr:SDR family NAD(P)-dependent oxidoreductase [Bradyrhizobium lablabi]SHL26248.1 NAD(P)-dependent dehydrogenase, short-chain alcohol dehydrogenase family [Bradyrhizobium lablabi]
MATLERTAIVVGVGSEQGLGAALARRFASEGHRVIVSGRTEAKIAQVVRAIGEEGGKAEAFTADATLESDVVALFDFAQASGNAVDLVVFNAGNNVRHDFRTMPAELFEQTWRVATFGGFLVGREAARRLAPSGQGSIIFTGATASLRGKPPFTAFASAKAALRSLAQSMAREFGPLGIHVAHVVIDGGIDGEKLNSAVPQFKEMRGADGLLNIDAIADAYWHLHTQHPSAWTHELDLRPFKEAF